MKKPEYCIDCKHLVVDEYKDGIVETKCKFTNAKNTNIEMLVNCPLKEA